MAHALLNGASRPAACLVGTAISAPLLLPSPASSLAEFKQASLRAEVAVSDGTCQLASPGTVHVSTQYSLASSTSSVAARMAGAGEAVVAFQQLVTECSEPLAAEYAYRQLAEAGLQYRPNFRLLRGIKRSARVAAATVQQHAAHVPAEFILNPAVLDCCLQLGGMVPTQQPAGGSKNTFIPASLAALYVGHGISRSSGAATAFALRPAGRQDTDATVLRNHMIVGASGSLVCQLDGLESKATAGRARAGAGAAAGSSAAASRQDMLYEIGWAAASLADLAASAATADDLNLAVASLGSVQLAAASMAAVQGALVGNASSLRLSTCSQHGVVALPAGLASTSSAGQLWGLLRTTAAECQTLAVSGSDGDALAAGSAAPATSTQLTVGNQGQVAAPFDGYGAATAAGSLYLPYMRPCAARSAPAPFQLFPQPRGALNNLAQLPVDGSATSLGPGQVLVAVKAVGINFRCVAE